MKSQTISIESLKICEIENERMGALRIATFSDSLSICRDVLDKFSAV